MAIEKLFTPPDLYEANEAWGANCGPGALAALLGEPVMGLRPLFPKSWTTPTVMAAALRSKVQRYQQEVGMPLAQARGHGLAFLQVQGRWDNAPERVQYRHTHWVAFARVSLKGAGPLLFIYDVNAPPAGGWLPFLLWDREVMAAICSRKAGASGLWRVRLLIEVPQERPAHGQ